MALHEVPGKVQSELQEQLQGNHIFSSEAIDDGISSLLRMAENMDAILPQEMNHDVFLELENPTHVPCSLAGTPGLPQNFVSRNEPRPPEALMSETQADLQCDFSSLSDTQSLRCPNVNFDFQSLSMFSREESCEGISNKISLSLPDDASSPVHLHSTSVFSPVSSSPNHTAKCYDKISKPVPVTIRPNYYRNSFLQTRTNAFHEEMSVENLGDRTSCPVQNGANNYEQKVLFIGHEASTKPSLLQKTSEGRKALIGLSNDDCKLGVSEARVKGSSEFGRVEKFRRTNRKPKTYSKPIASRFCHICSRMPRRGQGSAICKRIKDGLCRKIVCEQCIREQGWNYEDIKKNIEEWSCPHCLEICPSRSQCHIYNRINARRRKVGTPKIALPESNQICYLTSTTNLNSALDYGEREAGIRKPIENERSLEIPKILEPPPNFRLNLPFPYRMF